jgi:hypothetical protein
MRPSQASMQISCKCHWQCKQQHQPILTQGSHICRTHESNGPRAQAQENSGQDADRCMCALKLSFVNASPTVLLFSAMRAPWMSSCPWAMGYITQVTCLLDVFHVNFSVDMNYVNCTHVRATVRCRQPGGAQGRPAARGTGVSEEQPASSAAAAAGGSVLYQKAVPFQYSEQPAKQAPLPPPPGKASFALCKICA